MMTTGPRLWRAALAATAFAAAADAAAAPDVTLTVHHFLGPQSATQARLIEPWAKRITHASDGRIAFRIFPGMSLGGRPPELYRQLRDGVADIVWTLPGYTPGAFPRVEVFELPEIHRGSALQTTAAMQDLADVLAQDFPDAKPLLLHTHAGNALHLSGGAIAGVTDLRGLKLRTPSRVGGWAIAAWGAEAVGMPLPALPQALSKGVVDGALTPFEILGAFKLQELTTASVEGPDGLRFGTAVFFFGMNAERYAGLRDDLRAIIDAESGAALVRAAGAIWADVEAPGKALQAESAGGSVVALDPVAYGAMIAAAVPATERWIAAATEAGVDAEALLRDARAAMDRHAER